MTARRPSWRSGTVAAAGVVCLFALGHRISLAGQGPSPVAAGPQPVWSGENVGVNISVSPDGRLFSYSDPATGDLAIRELASGATRRLTNTGGWTTSMPGNADTSAISPDSREVAHVWVMGGAHELRLLPTGGGGEPRVVARFPAGATHFVSLASWTPDGRQLLVVIMSNDRVARIALVSVRDGSERPLKSLGMHWPRKVALSSDGRFIAYDFPGDDGLLDVFVMATDGSRDSVVVARPGEDSAPAWSVDGTRLTFFSERDGSGGLWTVGVRDGQPTGPPDLVWKEHISATPIAASPGGTFYYFTGGPRRNARIARLDRALNIVSAPEAASARFLDATVTASWSPDGSSLAYFVVRGDQAGSISLVIRSVSSGHERLVPLQLKTGPSDGSAPPRWFPDGRSVLVAATEPGAVPPRTGYYRVQIETGAATLLHSSWSVDFLARNPDLSPDGKVLYYSQSQSPSELRSWNLFRRDLENGRTVNLRDWFGQKTVRSPALSPDGKQLAYLSLDAREGSLEVIPATGGPAREILRLTPWFGASTFSSLGWTPDGRNVIFVWSARGEVSDTELYRISIDGDKPEKMGMTLNGQLRHPQVSPDGRMLAISALEQGTNTVWAIKAAAPRGAASAGRQGPTGDARGARRTAGPVRE